MVAKTARVSLVTFCSAVHRVPFLCSKNVYGDESTSDMHGPNTRAMSPYHRPFLSTIVSEVSTHGILGRERKLKLRVPGLPS